MRLWLAAWYTSRIKAPNRKEGTKLNLKELQNGSDIRGVAAGEHATLTPAAARRLAEAFVVWLRGKTGRKDIRIAVGMDSRLSGPDLAKACIEGIQTVGADAIDCGMASTPAMFMTTVSEDTHADGAIMVTASHLPSDRNGLKFFRATGGLDKADVADVIAIAEAGNIPSDDAKGSVSHDDFMRSYAGLLADLVKTSTGDEAPLKGMHIIVDAGNGAGGFYAKSVLEPLGADITGSQFLEPDGTFPNHIPNPEDAQAIESIVEAVKASDADFGIIFDTDVDRAGAVDKGGNVLNRDRLIAVVSAILLAEHPGTTIVTDSVTSSGLTDFIEAHGGKHHRFKRGYRNVINESIRLNNEGQDSQLAIETSGHAAFKENYFLDDGAYLVTRLLIELSRLRSDGKTLSDLIADLREPAESAEFRLPIKAEAAQAYGTQIVDDCITHYSGREDEDIFIAPNNYEGVRVEFGPKHGNGWFLLRNSLHEPLMPLNIESDDEGGVLKIARNIFNFLLKYPLLDSKLLANYVDPVG